MTARSLIEETVNSGNTLTQEELFGLFSRASNLVYDSLRLLVRENDFVQVEIVSLAAEVASNLDRNKAIYRRSLALSDDDVFVDVPADSQTRESDFLCAIMDLQLALAERDVETQLSLILKLPLTRMVLEQTIQKWHGKTTSYLSAVEEATASRLSEDYTALQLAETECFNSEKELGIDPQTGYGIVSYVSKRLSALMGIYDEIFNAYSRVVLKAAKNQAVSDDHALECFQWGSMGLLRAMSSYDHVSNARFVGHARWWIRQSMLFFLKEDSNLIKVSSNIWQHYAKLEALKSKHESKDGPLSLDELSQLSGYTKSHVDTVYSTVRTSQVRSIDHPLKSENNSNSHISPDIEEVSSDPLDYDSVDSVNELLDQLPTDLKNIVCLAFGLTEYVEQRLNPQKVEAERLRQVTASV